VGGRNLYDRHPQLPLCQDCGERWPMESTRRWPCRRQDQLHPHSVLGGLPVNWKAHLQVRDLPPDQRLEATCKDCGHIHTFTAAEIMRQGQDRGFLHIDELEAETLCKARGCRGTVRLAKVRSGDTSGFVGGLA
jgi:hypothetical protein